MGHRCTCIALIKLLPEGHSVLSQRYDPTLGCLNFDMALFDHLADKCKQKYGEEVLPKTKRGVRLLAACEKIRKLLSTIPEAIQHV
jgi:molecular chaperone DnaK (HSP70)